MAPQGANASLCRSILMSPNPTHLLHRSAHALEPEHDIANGLGIQILLRALDVPGQGHKHQPHLAEGL